MNTPTLPHVTLPSVSLPRIDVPDVTHRVTDRASDVGDLVSDVWTTGREKVQDLAAAAVDVIEDIPERAIAVAGAMIPALRPTPKRSKRRPFLIVVALVASVVLVAWFVKQRNNRSAAPYATPDSTSSTSVSAAS